jgi:hypothetical protein
MGLQELNALDGRTEHSKHKTRESKDRTYSWSDAPLCLSSWSSVRTVRLEKPRKPGRQTRLDIEYEKITSIKHGSPATICRRQLKKAGHDLWSEFAIKEESLIEK